MATGVFRGLVTFWVCCLLLISSCAQNSVSNGGSRQLVHGLELVDLSAAEGELIEADLNWLKRHSFPVDRWLAGHFGLGPNSNFNDFLWRHLKSLHFDPDECAPREVACTFPQLPHTVFIGERFFKLTRFARLATLFHEAHHSFRSTEHRDCVELPTFDCDESIDSPYGIELVFLTYLNLHHPLDHGFEKEILQRELRAAAQRLE